MVQGGDAEMPGMEPENKVTIEKMPDGSYQVEQGADPMAESAEGGETGQTFQSAQEACQAAIALLDGGGNPEAEIMDGYNGPSKQMKKVGVKEVFGG